MRYLPVKKLLLLLLILSLSACAHSMTSFEEFAPFNQEPLKSQQFRLPVIVVPGIKGSLLKKGDKEVWGKSYRVALAHTFDDLQLKLEPQLNGQFRTYYDQVGIKDGGIMEAYKIGFRKLRIFTVPVYEDIIDILNEVGGYNENNLFTFSYDWRLDNRIAAVKLAKAVQGVQLKYKQHLAQTLQEKFPVYWQELKIQGLLTADDQIQVNLVAHSMGGLVSRYYLQMLDGDKQVNKLILLGTPSLGAMDSLRAMAEGELPESVVHFYSKESTRPIIFSWASTFQLLPRYPGALRNMDNTPVSDEEYKQWGLGKAPITDQVIAKWSNYNLIPKSDESEQTGKDFLKYQLEDSRNFHLALAGNPNDPALAEYEKKKLRQVAEFLGEQINIPDSLRPPIMTRTVIFGGNCKPTLKYAFLGKLYERKYFLFGELLSYDRLLFNDRPLQSEQKDPKKPVLSGIAQGDSRVPVVSLAYSHTKNNNIFHFLLCEDHTGLVKNETFQYNLLSELLYN